MSKRGIYIFLIISPLIFSCKKKEQPKPEALTGKWERAADFPGSYRQSAFAFSIGNKGYVIGGEVDTVNYKDLWEYDPSINKWTRKADYPGRGHQFTGFEVDNKGYLYTGVPLDTPYNQSTTGFHEFYEYDPSTNKWTKKADFAGEIRRGPVIFSINGKGFIGLGSGMTSDYPLGAEIFNDFWSYSASTDKWTRAAYYPGNGYKDIDFVCNNKGYSGLINAQNVSDNNFWEYDPGLDKWTEKPWSYSGNKNGGLFVIGSKAYFGIGGNNNDPHIVHNAWTYTISNYISEFNPIANQWAKKADFPASERYELVCFSINNAGYAGLGTTWDIDDPLRETKSHEFWKFTP